MYEDSVLGRITAEQFQTLSGSYTEEMVALRGKIPEREAAIQALREQVCGADHFIALAEKYTDIRNLTPELLRLFIRKIVVHEKDVKWSKHSRQALPKQDLPGVPDTTEVTPIGGRQLGSGNFLCRGGRAGSSCPTGG